MVAVTPATRSPFSPSGTDSGSSAHGLALLQNFVALSSKVIA